MSDNANPMSDPTTTRQVQVKADMSTARLRWIFGLSLLVFQWALFGQSEDASLLAGRTSPDVSQALQQIGQQPGSMSGNPRDPGWQQEADRRIRANNAKQAGLISFLKSRGVETDIRPDGSEAVATNADGTVRWTPVSSRPFQDEQSRKWFIRSRDDHGILRDVDILSTKGLVQTDPRTGEQYFLGSDRVPVKVGVDQNIVEANARQALASKLSSSRANEEFDQKVNQSIARATVSYPDADKPGTPLHGAIAAEVARLAETKSPLLQEPDWPETLAAKVATSLGIPPATPSAASPLPPVGVQPSAGWNNYDPPASPSAAPPLQIPSAAPSAASPLQSVGVQPSAGWNNDGDTGKLVGCGILVGIATLTWWGIVALRRSRRAGVVPFASAPSGALWPYLAPPQADADPTIPPVSMDEFTKEVAKAQRKITRGFWWGLLQGVVNTLLGLYELADGRREGLGFVVIGFIILPLTFGLRARKLACAISLVCLAGLNVLVYLVEWGQGTANAEDGKAMGFGIVALIFYVSATMGTITYHRLVTAQAGESAPVPRPPRVPEPEPSYRIGCNGTDCGEMPLTVIRNLLAAGKLSVQDFYYDASSKQWNPLENLSDLR